jgi:hypothetical protein
MIASLLNQATAAGLTLAVEGDRLVVRGPREAGELARLLLARKREVIAALNGARCCGQRPPGTAGEPLVNACQLCPTSPTYWRAS